MFGVVDTRIKGAACCCRRRRRQHRQRRRRPRRRHRHPPGDSVAAGQLLATISRPEFDTRLRKAEARLAELRRRSDAAAPVIARSLRLGRSGAASEQATVAERLRTLTERQQLAAKRLQAQQTLFEQGLSTRQSSLSAQDQVDKLAIEQAGLQSRAKQLDFQAQEEQRGLNGESGQLALQVAEAERELAQLRVQQRDLMQVRAPHAGTVIELKTRNGLALPAGGDIASIELANGGNGANGGASKLPPPLSALIFVQAADGKLLQAGMSAEITPTNVKRQEFGFIRAQIGAVSAFPASREAINQRLNNPDVVKELAGDGVSTQIQSALLRRPDGNYAWSGAARQPPDVRSGSMCSAEIVVREQHPIEFVWPMIKKLTGTS